MALISVLNTVQAALLALDYDAEIADYLEIDASGVLSIPEDAQFVILPKIDIADYGWGQLKSKSATIQVGAFSPTTGECMTMLAAAETALLDLKFIPRRIVSLGRNERHVGYAQDFEKGHV